jgi:hypothetical protein
MERILRERGELAPCGCSCTPSPSALSSSSVADPMKEAVSQAQMDMTLDVMAHSLIYWTQEVVGRGSWAKAAASSP